MSRRSPVWALLIGIAAVPLAACGGFSETDRLMFEMEREQPLLGLMRRHEPETYAKLHKAVDESRKNGFNNAIALGYEAREMFTELLQRRIMTAPDESVSEFMKLLAAQAEELQDKPHLCSGVMSGRAIDFRDHLPKDIQEQEMDVVGDLLAARDEEQGKVASQEEAVEILQPILARGASALNLDEYGFQTALSGSGPAEDVCRAHTILLRNVADLPAGEGAALFRQIAQSQARTRYGAAY